MTLPSEHMSPGAALDEALVGEMLDVNLGEAIPLCSRDGRLQAIDIGLTADNRLLVRR